MSWNGDRSSPTRKKNEIPGAQELIERYSRLPQTLSRLKEAANNLLEIAEELNKEQQGINVDNRENESPKCAMK